MCQAVNDIDATNKTTCDVAVGERRHLLTTVSVVPSTFVLYLSNQIRIWFLDRRMNVEWASVLGCPLTTLKSLEAQHKETCPRLVHGETHALVICLFVEVAVTTEDLAVSARLVKNCLLHRFPKFIKRVLSL